MQEIKCKRRIAVLLATYNGEKYLKEQLDSLNTQTFQDFCCYIHDDGSTDHTVEIVQKYINEIPEMFVYVEGKPTGGAKNNFLFLLQSVNADYYMFCDQDDVWLPDKVEKTYHTLLNQNVRSDGTICIYSNVKIVDQNLKVIDESFYHYNKVDPLKNQLNHLIVNNVAIGCTMMFNRTLREKAIRFNDINNIYLHDWWIALVASMEGEIVYLNEALELYRQHHDNAVGAIAPKSFGNRVKRLLFDMKKTLRLKKMRISRTRAFARELFYLVDKKNKWYKFLKDFSEIDSMKKIQKIHFYKKYDLFGPQENKLWTYMWV